MNRKQLTILIIAPPGRLSDSLSVLLKSNNQIRLLGPVADPEAGLSLIVQRQPDTVIMDADLPNSALRPLLAQIKTAAPHTHRLLLTHSPRQSQHAQSIGVDSIRSAKLNAKSLLQQIRNKK